MPAKCDGLHIESDEKYAKFDVNQDNHLSKNELGKMADAGEVNVELFIDAKDLGQDEKEVVDIYLGLDFGLKSSLIDNSTPIGRQRFSSIVARYSSKAATEIYSQAVSDQSETAEAGYDLSKYTEDDLQALMRLNSEGKRLKAPRGVHRFTRKFSDVKLPGGSVFSGGTISFDSGRWYVGEGEFAIIDGVKIGSEDSQIMLYFGGTESPCATNYASFDRKNRALKIRMGTEGEGYGIVKMEFDRENPFFDIQEGNGPVIEVYSGRFDIVNRNSQGKIPLVKGYPETKFYLEHDSEYLRKSYIGISGSESAGSETAVVFEYANLNDQGEPIITEDGYNGEKIEPYWVFNDFGPIMRFGAIDPTRDLLTRNNIQNSHMTLDDFKKKYPGVTVEGEPTNKRLSRASLYLDSLTPEMRSSIKCVNFPNDVTGMKKYDVAGNASGDKISFRDTYFSLGIFTHEAAHIFAFKKGRAFKEAWIAAAGNGKTEAEIYPASYRTRIIFGNGNIKSLYLWPEGAKELGLKEKNTASKIDDISQEEYWKMMNVDSRSNKPGYGFSDPYGARNYGEDVASMTAMAKTNPKLLAKLIADKNDPYHEMYAKKVDLLFENSFISEEDYQRLLTPTASA